MISRAHTAAWNTTASVKRKLIVVATCAGGWAYPDTSRAASMMMKKVPVRWIARPNTAGQPLPLLLRIASRVPSPRSQNSASTSPAPIAQAMTICSQWVCSQATLAVMSSSAWVCTWAAVMRGW